MDRTEELYRLFLDNFPGIVREPETARGVFTHPGNHTLLYEQDGTIRAASVWNVNVLLLLCADRSVRGRGVGSFLLAETERAIKAAGYDEARFCDGFSYLTPGIPIGYPGYENNRAFFEKRGYVHSWGDCECVDMKADLTMLPDFGMKTGDTVRGVTYRFAREDDREAVYACALDAYKDFAKYYDRAPLYEAGNPERVLLAETDGKVVGILLVAAGCESPELGSVGCTATRPAYQNRGIATTMVKLGTASLAAQGFRTGYLGYTYTDIIPMYARSGYRVCMKYLMGVKKL